MRTEDFRYLLPEAAIAQQPAEPRDAAALLDTRDLRDHQVRDLPELLRAGDLVVVNRTRVRAARLRGRKAASGGAIEALLLRRLDEGRWEALVRPARRLQPGAVLDFGPIEGEVSQEPVGGVAVLSLRARNGGDVETRLGDAGEVPLPPYIRRPLPDAERYQTIFADRTGSAAAPTAGLHFTPSLVKGLKGAGLSLAKVDLQVGLDTFRPITSEALEQHQMHREWFQVDPAAATAIEACRRGGGRVIAVGTSVVRALESRGTPEGLVEPGEGTTDLFIRPGYHFVVVDGLITNFHVPASTLVVLLAAFMGPDWRTVYAHALARGYRFLSFGDAMYAERAG